MEHLAVELLEHIFTMACTDGGFTGCSLSLVSEHVRATSWIARFHSIALASGCPRQVALFAACLSAARAASTGTTPRVRHLLLVSPKREIEVQSRPNDDDDTEQLKFCADVTALLRIVAPDLYTCCLVHGHRPLSQELGVPFTGMRFPLLQEFTLVGSGKNVKVDDLLNEGDNSAEEPEYPSLTRLHLWLSDRQMSVQAEFSFWIAHAPYITHFRISNLGYHLSGVIGSLRVLSLESEDEEVRSFPALKRLIVQPTPGPAPGGKCGDTYVVHGRFIDHLQKMRHEAQRPFALLDAGEQITGSDFEGARQEWLGGVNGGSGCWDVETCPS